MLNSSKTSSETLSTQAKFIQARAIGLAVDLISTITAIEMEAVPLKIIIIQPAHIPSKSLTINTGEITNKIEQILIVKTNSHTIVVDKAGVAHEVIHHQILSTMDLLHRSTILVLAGVAQTFIKAEKTTTGTKTNHSSRVKEITATTSSITQAVSTVTATINLSIAMFLTETTQLYIKVLLTETAIDNNIVPTRFKKSMRWKESQSFRTESRKRILTFRKMTTVRNDLLYEFKDVKSHLSHSPLLRNMSIPPQRWFQPTQKETKSINNLAHLYSDKNSRYRRVKRQKVSKNLNKPIVTYHRLSYLIFYPKTHKLNK